MIRVTSDRRISRSASGIGLAAVFFLAAGLSAPAHAQFKNWNVGSGLWGQSANWNPTGVPLSNSIVLVDFWNGAPGTATVNAPTGSPVSLTIMNDNTVRIVGLFAGEGSLGVQGDLVVGRGNTHGTLNLLSSSPFTAYTGQATVGNTMGIGRESGVGTVNQNAGTVTVNQMLRVGESNQPGSKFTANGVYNLSGIGVLHAARLEVGYGRDNSQFPNMQGTFNLSGNAVLNVSANAQIPDPKIGGGGSHGVFNQTGGTFFSPHRILDIAPNGGSGVYNYSGGTFSVPGVNFSNNNSTFNYLAGPYLDMNQLSMSRGKVLLSGGGGKVLRTRLLWTSTSNWQIDLNNNAMVVEATLGESVASALFRGFTNGAWNGTGIRSSAAAAAPPLTRALGFGQAGDLGFTEYGGRPVPSTAWIIQYTRMGDADLNGSVGLSDFNRLAANFGAADKVWSQGDFNYDGVVSLHDFNLLASNFGLSASGPDVTPQDWASLAAAVPEPAGMLSVIALLPALHRRNRRQRGQQYRKTAVS